MGLLMLRELLRQGVEVDLYLPTYSFQPPPIEPTSGLRIIERRSGWRWRRWYSRTPIRALLSGLFDRVTNHIILSARLLLEHRGRPYDAVFQLSTTELFLLGRVRSLAPPIVVHPCAHSAGELRWHRAEREYALKAEPLTTHVLARALLVCRSRIQRHELERARLIIGPSRRFNELLHQDYGVPIEKLAVLRHPVDLERFKPSQGPAASRPHTLLFIARVSSRKGVPEVIALSHRLADLAGSVRLLVVGGATQWSDYRAHLADLNPEVAEYVGGIAYEQLPELMRDSSMLLVPSRYEPGSIVVSEALACGLPVVLSDEVGPIEVLSGPHVRSHRAGDVDGLERAVRSLLEAIETGESALRAAARANAEAAFSPQHVVEQLIQALSQLKPVATDGTDGVPAAPPLGAVHSSEIISQLGAGGAR
jgi:glycosyltransferase involved in cell wall biosynthesis